MDEGLEAGDAILPGKTMPRSPSSSATIRTLQRFTALGPLMEKLGNGGGDHLEHRTR